MDSALDIHTPISTMVSRSMPNLGSTFFLIIDQKYSSGRPWFVWAGSRADAVECVDSWGKWQAERNDHILSGNGQA